MALVEDSLLVNKPVICGFMKYGSLKNVSYTVQLLKAYIEIFKSRIVPTGYMNLQTQSKISQGDVIYSVATAVINTVLHIGRLLKG